MKYVKTYESFLLTEETVYSTGLGSSRQYAKTGDAAVKRKTLAILNTGKWKNTASGKYTIAESKRLADMWNAKDPSQLGAWMKDYAKDADGKLKESNYYSETALIVAVLDELTKRAKVEWLNAGGARSQCFGNSSKWAAENKGKVIGGIVAEKEITNRYNVESLVVHAFVEKDKKYYEVTFPTASTVANVIYWPLLEIKNENETQISQDIWSYALGIEEGVKEYITSL
jgi:hypothetical protein